MTQLHPAVLPPRPPEPESRRREGLLLGGFAVLGAIVVLGSLFAYQRFAADDAASVSASEPVDLDEVEETSPATSALPEQAEEQESPEEQAPETEAEDPSDPASEDTSDPASEDPSDAVDVVACPAEYDQVICDAAAFVQVSRGRPFKEFPTIELLTDAEFDTELLKNFDEGIPELVEDERVLKSLGLIPVETNLTEMYRSLLEAGVLGFYDSEIDRLVVRGGEFDLFGQSVLVHELVHAFDDQWFDLNRDEFENDDVGYGFLAVVEGNASRIEDMWKEMLSPEESLLLTEQQFASLSSEDLQLLRSLPAVLLEVQASAYVDGQRYVRALEAAGGEAAVDQRLTEPPTSSEQVLRSDIAAQELVVVELDEPAPGGSPRLSGGTIGELLIGIWLDEEAAAGWGGDRYVVWEDGDGACLAVDVATDTPNDALQLEVAASRWAAEQADRRTVQTVTTVDSTLVRITGCY